MTLILGSYVLYFWMMCTDGIMLVGPCLWGCSISVINCKPCSRLSIFRNWELNLIHLNDHKAIVHISCTGNTETSDRFTSTAVGSPSRIEYKNFKLKLSQSFPNPYQILQHC